METLLAKRAPSSTKFQHLYHEYDQLAHKIQIEKFSLDNWHITN
jgi:hypothetical protein